MKVMMSNIVRSPSAIALGVCRANRTTTAVPPLNDFHVRHLSSAPNTRHSQNDARDRQRTTVNNCDDEPWWSLSSLHRRVATVIAESLPDESLSAVHKSLSEKLSDAESHKSVSIGEAIVSARAREAHQAQSSSLGVNDDKNNNPQFVERQKQLEKEIEQRALEKAQERMQLELKAIEEQWSRKEKESVRKEEEKRVRMEEEHRREMAFEKWDSNAAMERQNEEQGPNANSPQTELKEEADSIVRQSSEETTEHHHPILGPQIAQLPYKRIHLTSATTLASLPVYEKQRAYRHDRAKLMAKDKKKTLWMGVPGVISLLEDDDGRLSILDGQHRVGMMALLEEERRKLAANEGGGIANGTDAELAELDLNSVLVEVFFPRDEGRVTAGGGQGRSARTDDGAAIFAEINKAEPVKLLDLPGAGTKRARDVIDRAASHFRDEFPAMFSASQRCRAPHLNLDNLREALYASEVIERENMRSGGELVEWMVRKNEELRDRYSEEETGDENAKPENGKRVNQTALKKAKKHDFYLGLESTWLYK